jgi:tetratricopeptide (TPR) repeat protein
VLSEAHTLLGRAYYLDGKTSLALPAFDNALELNPKNGSARYFRGQLYAEKERQKEARQDLLAATESRPLLPAAWFRMGQLLQASGDKNGAKDSYERYLRLAPGGEYAKDAKRELGTF